MESNISTRESLCDKCHLTHFEPSFFRTWMVPERGFFGYDFTLPDLRSSTSDYNCNWCSMVLKYVQDLLEKVSLAAAAGKETCDISKEYGFSLLDIDEFRGGGMLHLFIAARDWKAALSFTERLIEVWVGSSRHSRTFSVIADPEDEAATYISGRDLIRDLNSAKAFSQARLWLRECLEEHPTCSRPESSFFPARIIDLGQNETDLIFVRTNMTKITGAKYSVLSYCWGGDANFTTSTENIIQHETEGIPITSLPETVQDAIICTRKIGLQYLWVDALCIIQDSALDKSEQIPQIRSIFHYSTCTIVAGNSKTVYDGFINCRPPIKSSGPLPYFTADGNTGTFRLVPTQYYEYSEEPVNTRAWTLEEALLSPRLLIYSSGTLLWQCQAGNDIACRGAGAHIMFGPRDAHYRLPNPIFMASIKSDFGSYIDTDSRFVMNMDPSYNTRDRWRDPEQAMQNGRLAWADCLRRYTSRELTREHDKMQAISGLAEQYSLFFARYILEKKDKLFIAGLWKHDMPQALCWKRDSETSLVPRPKNYRAPSWSWASVDGMIHSASIDEAFNFGVLDIQLVFLSPNHPFGRIREGCEIRARGLLRELTWDLALRFVLPIGTSLSPSPDEDTYPEVYLDAAELIGSSIFGVPVQRHYSGRYEIDGKTLELPTSGWRYTGLLLQRVAGQSDCFQRVGAFQGVYSARFSVLWDKALCTEFKII